MEENLFRIIMKAMGMEVVQIVLSPDHHVVYALCKQGKLHYFYDGMGRAYFADNLYIKDSEKMSLSNIRPAYNDRIAKHCSSLDIYLERHMQAYIFRHELWSVGVNVVNSVITTDGHVVFAVCKRGETHYLYDGLGNAYLIDDEHIDDSKIIDLPAIGISTSKTPATRCPYKDIFLYR